MHSAHGCDLWVSVSPSVTSPSAVGLLEHDEASAMCGTSRWCLGKPVPGRRPEKCQLGGLYFKALWFPSL